MSGVKKLDLKGAGLSSPRRSSPAKTPRTGRSSAGDGSESPTGLHLPPWRCCPGSVRGTFGPHPPYIPENAADQLLSARSGSGAHTARSTADGSSTARSRRAEIEAKNAAQRLKPMQVGRVDPKKFTKSVIFMTHKSAMQILMKNSF